MLDALAHSMSTPMSVGRVSTRSELQEKRRTSDHAANHGAWQSAEARELQPNRFVDQATPFWEFAREPFSPSRTRSAEELHLWQQQNTRECFPHAASPTRRDSSALDARHAFQLAPDDTRFLHRKLVSGPTREQRGYSSQFGDLHGAAKPGLQSSELLVEAALKAQPKCKQVRWTDAQFKMRAAASGADEARDLREG